MLMKKQFQSKAVPRGTRTIWRYLGALFILFTFAIGNVWAATSTSPATKNYGGKTFLDVSATAANARIKNADSTLVYNATYLLKTLNPAWITGTSATDKSDTKSSFSNLPDYGFLAEGSSSGVNTTNAGGYSYIKITNSKEFVIYVTGTNSIAFLGKGNKDSSNKWIGVKVEEIDSEGNATVVADASSNKNYSSSNAITEATTNTASEALVISPNKYYRATVTSGNSSNCQVWQFRFGKYIAPATKYTVTYKAGEGTGSDVVDSDAKTVKAFADCSFTAPSGYEFKEWQDAGSNVVAAGASVSDNMTLTAIYRLIPTKYTVTYNLNGASGDAPTETSKAEGDAFNLAAAPSWAGHAFDGWLCNIDSDVKAAGSSYTMTAANTTFTAQWHELDCKIYSFTGGIGAQTVEAAATITAESMVLANSGDIIKLTPATGETFKAGDVVTISGTVGNTSKNFGVKISNAADKKATLGTASVAGTTVPLVATATLSANADYLYICRDGGTTTTLLTCEVHRSCAEGTAAGLSYAEAEVNKTEGDAKFTNALTNANGLILAGYKSSNAEVATVDFTTGEVTIVGPGSATISVNSAVQTKSGTLYAAGTASYALTVAALPKYTVTYDLDGGSGSPSEVDHKAGEKFNLHDGVTGITAPTNKTFVNWKDQDDALFAGGAEYTMPAKNVTLTAQWAGDVYTVKFMDGETVLDTKVVEVGSNPSDADIDKTKPLYTFAAWQKDDADIALDAAFWATVVKDATVTLTARWAKAYASNADFEAYIIANTSEKDDSVKADTYVKSLNYALSKKLGTTFDANTSSNNGAYAGLKIKNSGTVLSWNVVAGKVVELKAGVMVANGSLAINGGAATEIDGGSTGSGDNFKIHYFYSATEALYEFTTSNGSAEVIKAITMRDPYQVSYDPHGADAIAAQPATPYVTLPTPANGTGVFKGWYDAETEGNKIGNAGATYTPTASITLHAQWETVSSDNTLSDLKVDGVTIAGFDPAVQIYNLVYEYGQQPVITSATATAGALATVTINNTPVEEATFKYVQVKVEAESGAERFYQVRYTNAPKLGATIFKAELTAADDADYSGMYADEANSQIALSDDGANGYKFGGKSNFIKMAIADAAFAEGDMLKMTYTTNPQQGELAIYDGTTKLQGTPYTNNTLTFSDAVGTDKSTLYIRRTDDNKFNGWVAAVEVQRYMDPVIKSFTIGEAVGTIDQVHKTIAVEVPFGTNVTALTPVIAAYANGGATLDKSGAQDFTNPLSYQVSSAYTEDAPVVYTVTVTVADHYEAMIVGGANYETLAAAVAAANANDVVKLLDNVDLTTGSSTGLTIAANITLNLNGFNIKAGEKLNNNINVPAGVKLTLVDNSANAEGKIYTEEAYSGAATGYGVIRVSGEFLMQSGNIYTVIESDPANLGQFAVVIAAGGKVTVDGGQIKAGWYAISNNGNNTGSTIIVSGGELISTADYAIYNPAKESTVTVSGGVVYGAAGGIAMNRGELTVTGGTITSKDQGTTGTWGDGTGGMSNAAIAASGKYESVEVEISGGTIIAEGTAVMITNGTTNPVEVAISGGQFSHVVPEAYCAEGFAPVTTPNAQGKYEVEDKRIYIFDGSTMSEMATSPSGAISWEIVGSTMGATDKNGTYDNVNYTRALQAGNSSTTKHFKIDVALNNNAKIEVIGMSNSNSGDSKIRHAWLTNSTDKGEIANAIASLESDGYNPEYFATDWLEEGSYYLHSDNTVNIFLIRVTSKEVDPKCEQPTITAQPQTNITFGAGNMTATVEAEVTDFGTLKYQWYNAANDEAVEGATSATLTTADEGTYYVIVTNTKASHRDNSIKSDEAQLAHRVMNDATLSALSYGTPATAIALEADKYDYRVDLAENTTEVPALSATATMDGYATVTIHDAAAFVEYEAISTVEVTSEDGTAHKTYTVHFYVDHEILALVDVTGNMKWDFSKANDGTAATSSMCNEAILANVDGIVNNDDFESDNIMATANKFASGKLQASMIKFHTTVPGAVIVKCANTGSNKPMRYLYVNGIQTELGSTNGTVQTYAEYVPAGDVVLTVMPTTETGTVMFNFTSVEFKLDNDLEPARTDEWLAPGELGTICIPQGAVAVGADIYELVGKEPQYGKIVFESVEHMKPGKPYLFQAKGTRIDFILTDEAEASEPDNSGAMKGTFVNLDLTELDNVYYFANHALWSCDNLSSLSVPANRAYVKMNEVPALQNPNPAPGRRRVVLGVHGEQVVTGVENLNASEQPVKLLINGQIFILRGEKMFDVTGKLVK